jgi:hypothetical protein
MMEFKGFSKFCWKFLGIFLNSFPGNISIGSDKSMKFDQIYHYDKIKYFCIMMKYEVENCIDKSIMNNLLSNQMSVIENYHTNLPLWRARYKMYRGNLSKYISPIIQKPITKKPWKLKSENYNSQSHLVRSKSRPSTTPSNFSSKTHPTELHSLKKKTKKRRKTFN